MNEWQCQYAGCRNKVVGLGGAIGLRAIGWYFAPGPSLRCPLHRPDPAPCTDEATEAEERPEACSMCSGDRDARRWQSEMNCAYGFDGPTTPDGTEAPEKPWSHTMTDTQFAALHIRNRLVAYLHTSSAWSKRGPLDRCVHWAHVGCQAIPDPDYISVPFADHPDLAWLLGQALADLVTHVGSEALSEVLGQRAADVTDKLHGKPFHAPLPAAEPDPTPHKTAAAAASSAREQRCDFPGCGAGPVPGNAYEAGAHGWFVDLTRAVAHRFRCPAHKPSLADQLAASESTGRGSLATRTVISAPWTADGAHVTRAEFDALAERVARLETPPATDIDPKVEFNERCKELGARVRSKMLRPAGIVLSARDAYAMASELLSVLPSAHCSREPTINDCIVAVTGWGWPVEIIPAVARWLGFKDECGLEDALAEDVRRAVQARANS